MQSVAIGKAAAFPNPGRKVVEVDGIAVGVFCLDGKFTAYENVCPHMGGPVCQGKIIARVQELIAADKTSLGLAFSKDQTNVACPWHGYEFDISHRPAPGQSAPAAAAGADRGRRRRPRDHAPRGHARPDRALAARNGRARRASGERCGLTSGL